MNVPYKSPIVAPISTLKFNLQLPITFTINRYEVERIMTNNKLKQLRLEMDTPPKSKRTSKANRTFYLTEPQTATFIKYCKYKGHVPSEVLDRLITVFLDEVRDDLPPDSLPTPPAKD